jgi:endonuclease-8
LLVPEGDTVRKLAGALAPELVGREIRVSLGRAARMRSLPAPRTVVAVSSKGKHLYISLDDGSVLRSHLGLYGSWHGYAPGEMWLKPRAQASIVIATPDRVLVCFNAREAELLNGAGFRLADQRRRLGVDLAAGPPDAGDVVRRLRSLLAPDTPLADVLLDQRAASGIGNVYKCELLFLGGHHPSMPLGGLADAALAEVYGLAHELLRRNLHGGPRTTRFAGDGRGLLWVYGRSGKPCLRCGASVRRDTLGLRPRATYWCPGCQPAGDP